MSSSHPSTWRTSVVWLQATTQLFLWGVMAYGMYGLWREGDRWYIPAVVGGVFLLGLIGHFASSPGDDERSATVPLVKRGLTLLAPTSVAFTGVEVLAVALVLLETR